MNRLIKAYIYAVGIGTLLWNLFFVLYIFLRAYINPAKTYTININNYNEAFIEVLFILITIPFALLVIYRMKDILKELKYEKS